MVLEGEIGGGRGGGGGNRWYATLRGTSAATGGGGGCGVGADKWEWEEVLFPQSASRDDEEGD